MTGKLPQWLFGYLLALVIVVCATVLVASHTDVPSWFADLAIFATGGSTGAVIASHTQP